MPRRRRAWTNWAPFGLVLAILILTWLVSSAFGDEEHRRPPWYHGLEVLSWVASVLSLLVSVVLSRKPEKSAGPQAQIDDAVSRLADRVLAQSQETAVRLQLENPRALDVQYRAAPDELYDRWENIQRAPHGTDAPGAQLTGSFATVHRTYSTIRSGRLLILGRPGAGKTVLAHQLVLRSLDSRDPSAPVPVLFSLGKWEPSTSRLAGWMAEQLVHDHPHLNGTDPTGEDANLAEGIVRRGLVLPVLDGFDEVPDRYRDDAITKISEWIGPVIVTSRSAEYAAATRGAKVLSRIAGISVDDLTLEEAERYLALSSSKECSDDWADVFGWVRSRPTDDPDRLPLEMVLRTPLMVSLARTVYDGRSGHSPRELLQNRRFPTSRTIEDHLLTAYLTVRYKEDENTTRVRAGTRSWGPEQARRWLGYLSTLRRADFAWWQLSIPMHWISRVIIMGIVGMAGGAVIGLLSYSIANVPEVVITRSLPDDVFFLNYNLASTEIWTGLTIGLAVGTFNELKSRSGNLGREPERLHLRIGPRAGGTSNPREALIRLATDVVFGLALGLIVGIVSVLAWSFKHGVGQVYGLDLVRWMFPSLYPEYYIRTWDSPALNLLMRVPEMVRFEIDLVFGLALGSLIGIGYTLVNTLVHFLGDDVDRTRAANPWDSLATDRTITLVRVVLVGLIAGLIVGIAVGNSCYRYSEFYTGNWEEAVNRGTNYGVLYGSYAALIRLLPSAWGTWLVYVRFWLPLTGRLPWRPKTFLHDAHERQVLRHAGPAYQFRHARLREHLAEQRRGRTDTTQSQTRRGTLSSVTK